MHSHWLLLSRGTRGGVGVCGCVGGACAYSLSVLSSQPGHWREHVSMRRGGLGGPKAWEAPTTDPAPIVEMAALVVQSRRLCLYYVQRVAARGCGPCGPYGRCGHMHDVRQAGPAAGASKPSLA